MGEIMWVGVVDAPRIVLVRPIGGDFGFRKKDGDCLRRCKKRKM